MKTNTVLSILISSLLLRSAFGQGTLSPPGAPAPTMKSLAQIEPRTAISTAPFAITNSGSYYLTTNLSVTTSNAIIIRANHVTLDLNGFTISSSDTLADPSGTGVLLDNSAATAGQVGLHDIAIYNGTIAGSFTNNSGIWNGAGFNSGINYAGAVAPLNVRVRDVSVSGCFNYGILLGTSASVADSCVVQSVGSYGIYANSITRCSVVLSGNDAIVGIAVSDSFGNCIGAGDGIFCNTGNNSTGISASGRGLYAQDAATGCYGQSTTGNGLESAGVATGCYGWSTSNSAGGYGLIAVTAESCYGEADGFGEGVYGSATLLNCRGRTQGVGSGIDTTCANNCSGDSQNGDGVSATIAIGCWGNSSTTTNNINVFIGNSSFGNGGQERVTYKYNMP